MKLLLSVLLLVVGCSAPEPESEIALISTMGFAWEEEDGISLGFDLDDAVTVDGGTTGCGVEDFMSPDGVAGIDNSFAPILPALENVGGDALEPLVQESIDSGELLMLIEMIGLDDRVDDDCVDLHVQRGIGPPAIGTDGFILPGQTYGRDLDAPDSFVECATVVDGVLRAQPFSMRLPLNIFDEFVDFEMLDGVLEMELHEDGSYSGLFAGGVDTAELIANVNGLDAIPEEIPILVETIMEVRADLAPTHGGRCTRISITFQFNGVSAYLFGDEDE
jgi:hypothetical protein